MPDGDSFAGGTYPCPPEPEETGQKIKANITITFDIDEWFPKNWDYEEIKDYIESNYSEFDWQNVEVVEVDM